MTVQRENHSLGERISLVKEKLCTENRERFLEKTQCNLRFERIHDDTDQTTCNGSISFENDFNKGPIQN